MHEGYFFVKHNFTFGFDYQFCELKVQIADRKETLAVQLANVAKTLIVETEYVEDARVKLYANTLNPSYIFSICKNIIIFYKCY